MPIKFGTSYYDRCVMGPDAETICAIVLAERVNDTWEETDISTWYDDNTPAAKIALENHNAYSYMLARFGYEYEGLRFFHMKLLSEHPTP